jgi:hypothetical protein
MWNVDSRDWALQGQPNLIVDNLAQSTPEGGGVILFHDTQPQTVEALPMIIDHYTMANFKFTGVRELLAEKYKVNPDGIEANPNVQQPTAIPPLNTSGNNAPGDLSSLAECLTWTF